MARNTYANIYTQNILHNLNELKKQAKNSKILAVLKANAYGHGASIVANTLKNKVDGFGVCHIDEAKELRDIGIKDKILLLEGVFEYNELELVDELELDIVIHSKYQSEFLCQHYKNKSKDKIPIVWMKFDSAMGRLGFDIQSDIDDEINKILPYCKEIKFMSHFASANVANCTQTHQQIQKFEALCKKYTNIATQCSSANSAGIINYPSSHYDWVRAGLMLYGVNPVDEDIDIPLKPAMELAGSIIAIKAIKKGHQIGYGNKTKAKKDINIAIVSVGYADGYLIDNNKQNQVSINGVKYNIIGDVSMDMLAIEIPAKNNVKIGDKVQLWGDDINIKEVAYTNNKSAYELMCLITPRVSRIKV